MPKNNKGYLTAKQSPESDECLTTRHAVEPIIKYLLAKNYKTIWCPFDEDHSWYVRLLRQYGFTVINTHLSQGCDFFTYTPNIEYDCIVSNPPFSCYSEDTDVFTKRGWVNIKDIKKDDIVLSLNYNTNTIEWDNIKYIINRYVEEDLINFKNKNMDILVTKDHRMLAYNKYDNKLCLKDNDLITAEDVRNSTKYYMPRNNFKWQGFEEKYLTLPYLKNLPKSRVKEYPELKINLKDWLEFFGLWLADGCTRSFRGTGRGYTVSIKQADNNWDKVRKILDRLPFKYIERYDKKVEGKMQKANFCINNHQLWLYLQQFGKSRNKFIPQWIKELPTEYLQIFMKGYTFGDSYKQYYKGTNKVSTSIVYSSVSRQLIEDIQEILLKLGNIVQISKQQIRTGICWTISFCENRNNNRASYQKIKKNLLKEYKGNVYCLTLKTNSVFLVRRNDKIMFCGNCKDKVIERLYSLNKPFAMLMPQNTLQSTYRTPLFIKNGIEYLGFDKRISFYINGDLSKPQKGTAFASGYFCKDVLPDKLVLEKIVLKDEPYYATI